ncbi:MAG: CvpA family protein [Chitinophagales bacterium]
MWIDIIFLIVVVIGIIRGWKHGFIISVFITAAWILGIFGALKFCSVAAVWLRDHFGLQSSYTPVIAFVGVFIVIALVIYLIGKSLEKVIQIVQLGFVNRALGVVLRVAVFTFVFSLFIWMLDRGGFISADTKNQSKTYSTLEWTAKNSIDFIDENLPALKNIFNDIEKFFEDLSKKSVTTV